LQKPENTGDRRSAKNSTSVIARIAADSRKNTPFVREDT